MFYTQLLYIFCKLGQLCYLCYLFVMYGSFKKDSYVHIKVPKQLMSVYTSTPQHFG